MNNSLKLNIDRHKNIGLVDLLREKYSPTENDWEPVEEATLV